MLGGETTIGLLLDEIDGLRRVGALLEKERDMMESRLAASSEAPLAPTTTRATLFQLQASLLAQRLAADRAVADLASVMASLGLADAPQRADTRQ